jgi:hypothetical protein
MSPEYWLFLHYGGDLWVHRGTRHAIRHSRQAMHRYTTTTTTIIVIVSSSSTLTTAGQVLWMPRALR